MRTELLTESRPKTISLTDDQALALVEAGARLASRSPHPEESSDEEATDRSVIECIRAPGQDWRVVVRNAIGVVAIGDAVQLVVEPKIPTPHLLYLFEVAGAIPRLSLEPGELQAGTSLWELIARWFLRTAQAVLRTELLRDYAGMMDELRVVHGRIRPVETAQAHYGGRLTLTCEFDEFGPDTPLNRLLKAAARVLVRSPLLQPSTRQDAQRVLQRFDEVGDLRSGDLHASVDRVSAHYSSAIALAKHILASTGRSLEPGAQRAWTFLIRTPDLVEAGLRKLLVDAIGPSTIRKWPARIVGSRRTLNPDLVFAGGRGIADVKYKILDGDHSRADLYQSVAFATGFGCHHAAIVAFCDGPAPPYCELGVGQVTVRNLWWRAEWGLAPLNAASRLVDDVAAWLRATGLENRRMAFSHNDGTSGSQ